jgi:hypothetical protein
MKYSYSAIVILAFVVGTFGQQLYMPRNVARAFASGTRSGDGKPGPKYWQNKGVYNISLNVSPPSRTINGSEEVTYTNNSLNALPSLVIRLELNSHQPESPREDPVDTSYLTTGVHLDEISVNGKVRPSPNIKGITYAPIKLDQPLAPGGTVNLTFKWHVDLADHNQTAGGREGAIDPTTYFIAYFYPRIAVYDDTNGWDTVFFTEGHEFYNDFNDYTYQITVPRNFIVWGTGDLLNADEVLQPQFADRLKRSFTSDDVIHVATIKELNDKSVTKQSDSLTWKWRADNVSDVALAVSDHYIWDAGSVVVDKSANRRASVQAAYDEPSKDFEKMVEYGKHTLDWTANNYPGVPYPFQKTTIVRGWADMEYPMMVNDSSQKDPNFTRFVVEHEILHSWFPFYMGINEQRYGFMDEGWATAFEFMIGSADLGKEQAEGFFKQFRVASWTRNGAADADLPIITPADAMAGNGYRNNEYGKAALGYIALKDLLGDAEFSRVLHKFIDDWHGKHPLPWDMFNSFNSTAGRDLNWFFKSWYFDNGYIDLALDDLAPTTGGYNVTIRNVGGFVAPVNVVVQYTDDSIETLHQTPAMWAADQKRATVKINTSKTISLVTLDGGIWMDANMADNKLVISKITTKAAEPAQPTRRSTN